MLADDRFVLCEVDTEGHVLRHIALDPLNIRAKLIEDIVRFGGGRPQLLPFEAANFRILRSMTNMCSAMLSFSYGGIDKIRPPCINAE